MELSEGAGAGFCGADHAACVSGLQTAEGNHFDARERVIRIGQYTTGNLSLRRQLELQILYDLRGREDQRVTGGVFGLQITYGFGGNPVSSWRDSVENKTACGVGGGFGGSISADRTIERHRRFGNGLSG